MVVAVVFGQMWRHFTYTHTSTHSPSMCYVNKLSRIFIVVVHETHHINHTSLKKYENKSQAAESILILSLQREWARARLSTHAHTRPSPLVCMCVKFMNEIFKTCKIKLSLNQNFFNFQQIQLVSCRCQRETFVCLLWVLYFLFFLFKTCDSNANDAFKQQHQPINSNREKKSLKIDALNNQHWTISHFIIALKCIF